MDTAAAGGDYLLAFAQIGVALAGFSSLVALLGARSGQTHRRLDAIRLQIMLEASLFVAFFSLSLPDRADELRRGAGIRLAHFRHRFSRWGHGR
jgi:hypothetical protein